MERAHGEALVVDPKHDAGYERVSAAYAASLAELGFHEDPIGLGWSGEQVFRFMAPVLGGHAARSEGDRVIERVARGGMP